MPEKQPTKREKQQVARQRRRNHLLQDEANRKSRRKLLLGLITGGATLAGLTTAINLADKFQDPTKPATNDLLPTASLQAVPSQTFPNIYPGEITPESVKKSSTLNRDLLVEVVTAAQQSRQNTERGVVSLLNNLSLVRTRAGQGSFSTNALMLDDSGLYLTCGHTFISATLDEGSSNENPKFRFSEKNLPASVVNPSLKKRYPILQYIADPALDLAIFYAPTGYRSSIASNPTFETGLLPGGTQLWQPAFYTQNNTLNLQIMYGVLDQNKVVDDFNQKSPYKDRLGIKGMIPFGGSSGASIITSQGKVFAVESGYFVKPGTDMTKQLDFNDYDGSMASSINHLLTLAKTGEIKSLPQ